MKSKKILVTGGLGYIGSHVVVELQNIDFEVIIIDNLLNTRLEVLDGITAITGKTPSFTNLDMRNKEALQTFFESHQDIAGVIHFAASKAVGESVENPLFYYENNINTLVYLLQNLENFSNIGLIFSSSCTVYGEADNLPIKEVAPVKKAASPYGNTKQVGEQIIADVCNKGTNLKAIALRYFNPIGAHETALIGELPLGIPQNLVPYITQTAAGIRSELSIYGNDYNTADGTCIRDYIHVVDLAKAHVAALQRIMNEKQKETYEVFNIGTGKGSSVLEALQSFMRATNQDLPHKIVSRRDGDIVAAYADTTLATTELGWEAKHSLDEAMASAWKWQLALGE